MKAWDDNFVSDTGTARRKGQNHGPFPFFSLSPFNSTSLFVSFCWQLLSLFWCHPNVSQKDPTLWTKCSCYFWFVGARKYSWLSFKSMNLLKKGDKKIFLCLSWKRDGRPVEREKNRVKKEKVWGKKERERKRNTRKEQTFFCFFLWSTWKTVRDKDKAIM